MRVLIVGEDQEWSIERSFVRGFTAIGVEAHLFDWWLAGAPRGDRRLVRRPVWPLIARRANPAVIRAARDADVVFVVKGLLFDAASVEELRQQGKVVVCFNPDNPWNRARTSYSRVAELAMPAYDAFLIWAEFLVSRLYAAGCRRVEVLRFAWDDTLHPHVEPGSDEFDGIVLVANHSDHRERWVQRLADLPLVVYGPAWAQAVERLPAGHAVLAEPVTPVGMRYAEAVARSAVSLNLLDPHNCPGTNMRSFEVPGIGGVTLSAWTEDVAELFPEVATFRTEEDLRAQIAELRHDAHRRAAIRRVSHDRVAGEHTYVHRARQLQALFEDLF